MQSTIQVHKIVRYYWRHIQRYRRLRLGLLLSLPITVLCNSYLPPLVLASVLGQLSQHNYQPHRIWASFGPQLGLYALLLIAGMGLWRVVDYFTWRMEWSVQRNIADEVFDYMLRQTANFHADNFSGSLVSQTNKLLAGYVRIADTTIFGVAQLVIGLACTVVILLPRAPLFVLLLLGFAVIYIYCAFIFVKPVQRRSAHHAAAESAQTGYLADAITNILAIKSFANEPFERRRFAHVTNTTQRSLQAVAKAQRTQMNYLGLSSRFISGLSLTMAVIGVMVFKANIATVFLILSYTSSIVDQLFNFSNSSLRNYNRAFGDANDMVALLEQPPEVVDPKQPEKVRIQHGAIVFDAVSFTHSGADDAIFDKLNLHIKPGEKVGLVGQSGSGKTTFTRLLLRFSDIDSGEILIDGQNIAHITQHDLHSKLAYVPQEPLLFHRSIAENIRYGQLDADEKAVFGAAKLAHADDFIRNLPQGYETLVGERGVKLSGGQRQRVAIARALLKNAPILLLDEATSALDSESEVLIQDALWKLMEGRTAIVIAHRLSTIQKMDRIIVMQEGQIVEQGSHQDLLQADGIYAKLWAHQSGGFIDMGDSEDTE